MWRVSVNRDAEPQDFIVAIPYTFPDVLPKIYLPVELAESGRQIPHVDRNRFLCSYDEVTSKPNADDPGQIAIDVLNRAIGVFRDGVAGINEDDFNQELEAYWGLDSTLFALSLVGPDVSLHQVVIAQLQPPWRNFSYMFAATAEDVTDWLTAVGSSSKTEMRTVPFLHLKTLGQPPLPSTNGDIYGLLARYDPNNLSSLLNYLKKAERPCGVLFSAAVDSNNRMLGAWWHPQAVHQVNRGPGRAKRHRGVVPGFRSGSSTAASVELSMSNKQGRLTRATIDRVDKARLFARTVGSSPISLEHRLNLVGCGSLGGFTAVSLVQTGAVDRLRLIDPQPLDIENVQRHYCGMSYIGEPKVDATKRKLEAHFPHADCEPYQKNVLDIIRTTPTDLVPSSLTIVSVADIAVERRLNRLFNQTQLFGDGPICFMWVEPMMFAGHAVLVQRGSGCFECAFDELLMFEDRVVGNPDAFSQRESGCQTTFIPYSGLDALEFTAQAVRFVLKYLHLDQSFLFSWIGDIDQIDESGGILQDRWKGTPAFSTHVKPLAPRRGCATCGNNELSLPH